MASTSGSTAAVWPAALCSESVGATSGGMLMINLRLFPSDIDVVIQSALLAYHVYLAFEPHIHL